MCSAGFARTLNARERERSGLSVWYVQSRICSHAQRKRASGEVWSGQVSIICAKQDLLAHSAQESSARGRVRSVSSEKEIACARGRSHTQRERAQTQHERAAAQEVRVRARSCLCKHSHTQRERSQEVRSGPYHMRKRLVCERSLTHSVRGIARGGSGPY